VDRERGGERRERFRREARIAARLSHSNVVQIFDIGRRGDRVFLAMEFLSGGTLRDWITAKKRPWREVVNMFIEVGKGLAGQNGG
jgi:serine/threonine protein kinase